jgi:hypothetical protein
MGDNKESNGVSIHEIEDLIHNFLIIILEHSMRQKDGWKVSFSSFCYVFAFVLHNLILCGKIFLWSQDVEATIHCAEWLSMVGGSSTGDHRIRY